MTKVESVLKRLNIEARKEGRLEWRALCPNPDHEDRNPSWRIRDEPGSERDGMHKCWPCDFGGGIVHLVKTVLKCTYPEAYKWIESSEVAKPPPIAVHLSVRSLRTFRLPEGVEIKPFDEWTIIPTKYAKKRGITPEQIERWSIGYAVEGRLEGRLVFPIRTRHGRLAGYTARTMVNHEERYKEPDLYERANRGVMWGEQFWVPKRPVIVVEGALKALAVERVRPDINLAVTSGSSVAATIAFKLASFTDVIINTDQDDAGDRLANEIAFSLNRQQVWNHRLRFEGKKDADRMDPNELLERINGALDALR